MNVPNLAMEVNKLKNETVMVITVDLKIPFDCLIAIRKNVPPFGVYGVNGVLAATHVVMEKGVDIVPESKEMLKYKYILQLFLKFSSINNSK